MSVSCSAPNDRLLEDGISTEVYRCELELGHRGPHMSTGHPEWWDHEPSQEEEALITKTGKVLTDADIEALADEAEAGYELTGNERDRLTEKERVAKKWRAAALEDALPDDAAAVADRLVPMEYWARREYDDMTEADTLARAIAILRGEP